MLYSFCSVGYYCTDGYRPLAGLIADQQGALYSTTEYGGSKDYGTVFKLTPPAKGETAWRETVLYSFTGYSDGYDGRYPMAGLIAGSDGVFYGTTSKGGDHCAPDTEGNCGTVFELTPPASDGVTWTERVLLNFCWRGYAHKTDCPRGAIPVAGLIADQQGALYGTTQYGGTGKPCAYKSDVSCGTAFKLTPPPNCG